MCAYEMGVVLNELILVCHDYLLMIEEYKMTKALLPLEGTCFTWHHGINQNIQQPQKT